MSKIQRLDFDSNLFGYEVGKVTIASKNDFIQLDDSSYKLIYVTPEKEDPLNLVFKNEVVHEKISLINENLNHSNKSGFIESYLGKELDDDLLNLTLQSGIYSRFATDTNFKSNEFWKLYKIWIEKSLSGEIADEVYVYKTDGEIDGFITLSVKGEAVNIGLLAVNKHVRGKGIGEALIEAAFNFSKEKGFSKITVDTQGNNELALKFYNKFGFTKYNSQKIYHHWNL